MILVAGRRGLIVSARGMTTMQVKLEPSDEVVVEGCCSECCYEFDVFDSV